jgi:hypothetical protein
MNIKKLDEYFDMLSEVLNNPLPIKWIDNHNKLRGLFTVNDNIYQIVCENKNRNIWRYDFYFYKENKEFTTELTGINKDKFRVLPTVELGIKYLFENKNPDAIVFGASDNSKGRKKIYESFCFKFSKDNNLEFYTKVHSDIENNIDRQIFIMFKKTINRDILSETIFKILEDEKF